MNVKRQSAAPVSSVSVTKSFGRYRATLESVATAPNGLKLWITIRGSDDVVSLECARWGWELIAPNGTEVTIPTPVLEAMEAWAKGYGY